MYRELLIERWNPSYVDMRGEAVWHNSSGELHRENDFPAIIDIKGGKSWLIGGQLHRGRNRPAVIEADASVVMWWRRGRHHTPPIEIKNAWFDHMNRDY